MSDSQPLGRSNSQVHARNASGRVRLVRDDRAGKYRIEDIDLDEPSVVTLEMAVRIARHWEREGGEIFFGRPGGRRFDARVRKAMKVEGGEQHG